jgi:amidase
MSNTENEKTSVDRRSFVKSMSFASAGLLATGQLLQACTNVEETAINGKDICFMDAIDIAAAIQSKKISAVEVMNAFYDRIEKVNPKVNAIVALLKREEALKLAKIADEDLASGKPVGKLHGMPWALKDMEDVKGFPTTKGSVLFKDYYPKQDGLLAEKLRAAGVIFIGKTNVPEFGAGSNTINPVYGPTLNPYDLALTCGGSTGGGAVAVATYMLPFADGSDTGGSCRNPGSWNNIIGFRPSIGRVAYEFPTGFFLRLPMHGPMARSAKDAAFLLSVMAGPDYRDPISLLDDPAIFAKPLDRDFKGTKIAWTSNLGYLEVQKEIVEYTSEALPILKKMGCEVEDAHPEMPEVFETNKALRSLMFAYQLSPFSAEQKKLVKESVQWEASEGMKLNAMDVAIAETRRAKITQNITKFLEKYEFLVLPVTQVLPFPVGLEYPTDINGKQMRSYLEWMEIVYAITLTGLPAISVPCTFTKEGIPVGLQIVGRRSNDLGVLQLAHAFEKEAKVAKPIVPKI